MTDHNDSFAWRCNSVFDRATADYHVTDSNRRPPCPLHLPAGSHRSAPSTPKTGLTWHSGTWRISSAIPQIDPAAGMELKHRIDASNQDRTDRVEDLDTYFRDLYSSVAPQADAQINTESPAWALDRLSILAVKIFHMKAETERTDATAAHLDRCRAKLAVLLEQRTTFRRPSTPSSTTSPPAANT